MTELTTAVNGMLTPSTALAVAGATIIVTVAIILRVAKKI